MYCPQSSVVFRDCSGRPLTKNYQSLIPEDSVRPYEVAGRQCGHCPRGHFGTAVHEAIATTINDENVDAASRRVKAARVRFYINFKSRHFYLGLQL